MGHKEILKLAEGHTAAIAKHTSELSKLRTKFEKIIVDKSIPLDERWAMFEDAPDDFHHQTGDCIIGVDVLDDIYEFNWGDACHASKYQEIDFKYYACNWVGEVKAGVFKDWMAAFEEDPELLAKFQEQVLAANINSFTLDW